MSTCTEVYGLHYPCQLPAGHDGHHKHERRDGLLLWSDRSAIILSRPALELAYGNIASQSPTKGPTAEEIDEELRKREPPAWIDRARALLAELESEARG